MSEPIPSPVPHGRTARRLEWAHLPPALRALVERRCGSPVVEARSQGAGFTPGFAAVLVCEDGSRHFVKAASVRAQRPFAAAYREEARKLAAAAGRRRPHPGCCGACADDDWVVLGIEHVEARPPRRPWRADDLERCLRPDRPGWPSCSPRRRAELAPDTFAADFADWPGHWEHVRPPPDLPAAHVEEAAALAARFAEATAGDALVHTDVRDDNLLLCDDGRTLLCDWNWPGPRRGVARHVFLLIGPRGDGLDVETVLADAPAHPRRARPSTSTSCSRWSCGYFLKSAADPVPPTSPYLRDHQRWCAEVTLGLAGRAARLDGRRAGVRRASDLSPRAARC